MNQSEKKHFQKPIRGKAQPEEKLKKRTNKRKCPLEINKSKSSKKRKKSKKKHFRKPIKRPISEKAPLQETIREEALQKPKQTNHKENKSGGMLHKKN